MHRAMREATGSVLAALVAQPRALMELVGAGGVAVVENGEPVTCGGAPPADVIREIARWLEEKGDLRPFSTASLGAPLSAGARGQRRRQWSAHVRAARRSADVVPPGDHPDGELGRRSNQARRGGAGERLRPRHSFALWKEEVRARSRPWTPSESRGRGRAAAPRHRSGHRAASLQRAARRAGARRAARGRVPRPEEPAYR